MGNTTQAEQYILKELAKEDAGIADCLRILANNIGLTEPIAVKAVGDWRLCTIGNTLYSLSYSEEGTADPRISFWAIGKADRAATTFYVDRVIGRVTSGLRPDVVQDLFVDQTRKNGSDYAVGTILNDKYAALPRWWVAPALFSLAAAVFGWWAMAFSRPSDPYRHWQHGVVIAVAAVFCGLAIAAGRYNLKCAREGKRLLKLATE